MLKRLKLLKLSALVAAPAALSVVVVACGNVVNSNDRINQDVDLSKDETKTSATDLHNEFILSSVYKINNIYENDTYLNDETTPFFKDAFAAYKFYFDSNSLSNLNFFNTQRTDYMTNGYDHYTFINSGETLELDTNPLSVNNFKILFLNHQSPVRKQIVSMLLINNYLNNQSVEDVKKSTNYDSIVAPGATSDNTKTIFQAIDLNNANYAGDFFLMQYLLNGQRKLVLEWKLSGSLSLGDVIGGRRISIRDVNQFNRLTTSQTDRLRIFSSENINIDLPEETARGLIAFNGLKVTTEDGDDLDYTIDNLKKQTSVLHGFYDVTSKKLYSINTLANNNTNPNPDSTNAATEVIVSQTDNNGASTLNANYFVKITPDFVKASQEEIDKALGEDSTTTFTGFFTLASTPWNTPEQKRTLAFWLAQDNANALSSQASNYYKDIGYTASSDRDDLDNIFNG